jgi:RNA-binding protein 23/39
LRHTEELLRSNHVSFFIPAPCNHPLTICRESGDDWVKELEEEVREECEAKYGHVVHIAVEPNSNGEIYIKFDSVASGEKAILGLNGRYFGGFQITAQPVVDAVYSSLFSRTRAM